MDEAEAFTYDGGRVDPGQARNIRYTVSETYLGDPVKMPVTIVNGEHPGPTVFLSAATHGDELNGIEVVREVAHEWDLTDLRGTVVCLPVLNVPGFIAQERYLPVYDRDLNRAFPGDRDGTGAERMAARIFDNFLAPCDLGIDVHTSTRGRTNMLHVRADMEEETVARVAKSFASHLIIDSTGPPGTLRREATEAGASTITVEAGEAHRFQRPLIDRVLSGVTSVFAEFGLLSKPVVQWPGWRTVIEESDEKTWIRADTGGLVDMRYERGAFVEREEVIATITNPFKTKTTDVYAPFDGLLVGVLENPVVYPGNPLCHFARVDAPTRRAIEAVRGTRLAGI